MIYKLEIPEAPSYNREVESRGVLAIREAYIPICLDTKNDFAFKKLVYKVFRKDGYIEEISADVKGLIVYRKEEVKK